MLSRQLSFTGCLLRTILGDYGHTETVAEIIQDVPSILSDWYNGTSDAIGRSRNSEYTRTRAVNNSKL